MDNSTYYQRATLLKTLIEAVQSQLSEDTAVYSPDRPRLVPTPQKQFVVLRLVAGIQDSSDIHQQATVSISCFRRDKTKGLEDIPGMQTLLDAVCDLFPLTRPMLSASKLKMVTGGSDDELGFHYVTLQTKLVIRK